MEWSPSGATAPQTSEAPLAKCCRARRWWRMANLAREGCTQRSHPAWMLLSRRSNGRAGWRRRPGELVADGIPAKPVAQSGSALRDGAGCVGHRRAQGLVSDQALPGGAAAPGKCGLGRRTARDRPAEEPPCRRSCPLRARAAAPAAAPSSGGLQRRDGLPRRQRAEPLRGGPGADEVRDAAGRAREAGDLRGAHRRPHLFAERGLGGEHVGRAAKVPVTRGAERAIPNPAPRFSQQPTTPLKRRRTRRPGDRALLTTTDQTKRQRPQVSPDPARRPQILVALLTCGNRT
jgi:hypothetical protein